MKSISIKVGAVIKIVYPPVNSANPYIITSDC